MAKCGMRRFEPSFRRPPPLGRRWLAAAFAVLLAPGPAGALTLRELLDEVSPIQDFTGGRMELRFGDYHFEEPKYTEAECRDRERTYAAPLRVSVELLVKETGEIGRAHV